MSENDSKPKLFPSSGLIGFFSGEQVKKFLPCIILVGAIFVLCSMLAWPYLIKTLAQPTDDGIVTNDFCTKLVVCGVIGCVVAAITISIKACTVKSDYQVESSITWCYSTCLVVIWIAMLCYQLNPLGQNANWLLVTMVMGIIGVIIAFVPAAVSLVIGILARVIRIAVQKRW